MIPGKDGLSIYLSACALAVLVLTAFGWMPAEAGLVVGAGFAGGAFLAMRGGSTAAAGQPTTDQTEAIAEFAVLESVIAALPYPVIILDQAGSTVSFNRAAGREFPAFRTGRHITSALRPPDIVRAVEAVLGGGSAQRVEFTVHTPVQRSFGAVVLPLPDERHAFVALTDLSETKRVEQLRADFVANASHELRTPLAALSGFVETLQGPARDDPEARDEFLSIMAGQAARMGRLIEDLLSLSRIELNEHVVPDDTVLIGDLVNEIFSAVKPGAVEREIDLENHLTDPVQVIGESDQLMQVFQNLIDNAVKYGRQGTPVVVSLSPEPSPRPGLIGISVRDRGIGISRRHLPRLTERFYRVDVAQSREKGGTGLGLAIVKHIINRHRGMMTIDSDESQGSTFTVWLPRADG